MWIYYIHMVLVFRLRMNGVILLTPYSLIGTTLPLSPFITWHSEYLCSHLWPTNIIYCTPNILEPNNIKFTVNCYKRIHLPNPNNFISSLSQQKNITLGSADCSVTYYTPSFAASWVAMLLQVQWWSYEVKLTEHDHRSDIRLWLRSTFTSI
jgi:hypothetical protein